MTVLVTGASGTLGSVVLPRLAKDGYEVRPMSRAPARTWLDARNGRRPIWRLRLPGGMSRAIRAGGQTTAGTPAGTRAWRDYLAGKY